MADDGTNSPAETAASGPGYQSGTGGAFDSISRIKFRGRFGHVDGLRLPGLP
jgi:hypothetical protein